MNNNLHPVCSLNQGRSSLDFPSRQLSNICPSLSPTLKIVDLKNGIFCGWLNKNRNKNGIGMLFHDDNKIWISQFQNGVPSGSFFLFQGSNQQFCCYGQIKNNKIIGNCCIYTRNNCAMKVSFEAAHGRPSSEIFNLKEHFDQEHNIIYKDGFKNNNSNKIQHQKNSSSLNPIDFLKINLTDTDISSAVSQQRSFQVLQLTQNQVYFGSVKGGKPHGCGVIFMKKWPICYGMFDEGQMCGLGRVQQSGKLTLDGMFEDSCFNIGWVINTKQNTSSFGYLNNSANKNNKFQFCEEYSTIKYDMISGFRRSYHMKSIDFENSYCPEFWNVICQHFEAENMKNFFRTSKKWKDLSEQKFIPSFISDIEEIQKTIISKDNLDDEASFVQRNLIDLIKQYNDQRNNYQENSKTLQNRLKLEETQKTEESASINKNRGKSTKARHQNGENMEYFRSKKNEAYIGAHTSNQQKMLFSNGSLKQKSQNNKSPIKNQTFKAKIIQKKPEKNLNLHQIYRQHLKNTK